MIKKRLSPFEEKKWLASPTMHGEELKYIEEAYRTNWMSTIGENLNESEKKVCEITGSPCAVALSSGTAALHMAIRLAGEKLYGSHRPNEGSLKNKKVFCSDMTFDATVNPVAYEGGEAVFIDGEYETWNMDPKALRKAFEIYPDVRLVVVAHLYGTPAKADEIRKIVKEHGALLVEDAAESFGASYRGKQTGTLGDYNVISFNGNKIITGSSGGMFLSSSREDAEKVRKWSTQSREAAPWYEHEETGYNYRMSNVIAGVVRGQLPYLFEHIEKKKAIYERYKKGFEGLKVSMNPFDKKNSSPNYWLSCLIIDRDAMCETVRGDRKALFIPEEKKSCPTEILQVLSGINAEGRPIWKPMHLQPMYRGNAFITRYGNGRANTNAYIKGNETEADSLPPDIGRDIFERGLCLPSDIKMKADEQDRVIEAVRACFD